jgi:hypothetical protein
VREAALDRLVACRQRLDELGRAIEAARRIILGAKDRRDPLREAAGHLNRYRILIGLADTKPTEAAPVLDLADELVVSNSPPPETPPYLRGSLATVAWTG